MELSARTTSTSRCPYCHDMLQDGAELVACPQCHTQHHEVCAAELGRCSVLGCAAPVEIEREPGETEQRLAVRRRVRARVQRFVQAHGRRMDEQEPSDPRLRLRAEIVRAKEAWERGDWPETRAARAEIEHLEADLDHVEAYRIWEALGFDRVLRLDLMQEGLEERHHQRRLRLRLLGVRTLFWLAVLLLLIATFIGLSLLSGWPR